MAGFTITIQDVPEGRLGVEFKADNLKTASTLSTNTAAQNAAVLLAGVMRHHGMLAPDLSSDEALKAWLEQQQKS